MTERKSPTAVLREGPRALSEAQVREIEDSALAEVLKVDIDDVIEYVHKDLRSLPDFTTLYRKYLKQRWDVYDLDFTQDKIDWEEKMTEEERQSRSEEHTSELQSRPRRREVRQHDRTQEPDGRSS